MNLPVQFPLSENWTPEKGKQSDGLHVGSIALVWANLVVRGKSKIRRESPPRQTEVCHWDGPERQPEILV